MVNICRQDQIFFLKFVAIKKCLRCIFHTAMDASRQAVVAKALACSKQLFRFSRRSRDIDHIGLGGGGG